jgi:predicted ArsR family transcriptional regulator
LFPRRYDLLAQVILEEVSNLSPADIEGLSSEEKQSLLVQRAADKLAERYRYQVEGRSLEGKVAAVTGVLQLIGGFAEWLPTDHGYEIRDYNCVFSRLVPETPGGCECHVRLLTRLLQWPVSREHVNEERGQCCRYVIIGVPDDD